MLRLVQSKGPKRPGKSSLDLHGPRLSMSGRNSGTSSPYRSRSQSRFISARETSQLAAMDQATQGKPMQPVKQRSHSHRRGVKPAHRLGSEAEVQALF